MVKPQQSASKSTQCPICYQQSSSLRQICTNSHKICQKCLFTLRRRQCPICKNDFKINRIQQSQYEIIFNQQDHEHNNIAFQEDIVEQQEAIRRYYGQIGQNQQNGHYAQNTTSYGGYMVTPMRFRRQDGTVQVRNVISGMYDFSNFYDPGHYLQNQQELIGPGFQVEESLRNRWDDFLSSQNFRERQRIQRRNRDQQMYEREVRNNAQEQGEMIKYEQSQKQPGCSIMRAIGRFFVSIGEKLGGQKQGKQLRNNQRNRNEDEYHIRSNITGYENTQNRHQSIYTTNPMQSTHHPSCIYNNPNMLYSPVSHFCHNCHHERNCPNAHQPHYHQPSQNFGYHHQPHHHQPHYHHYIHNPSNSQQQWSPYHLYPSHYQ